MSDFVRRLKKLVQVGYYEAPSHANVQPFTVPKHIELVELLTGGEVFFDINGQTRTFRKGTIFWHKTGEETIFRTTPQAPYRCVVFHFQVRDQKRPAPRVSFWNAQDEAQIDRFMSEAIELFHSHHLDKDVLMIYLYSSLLRHAMTSTDISPLKTYPRALDHSLDFIHHHLNTKITITTLAKRSDISKPQLFRLFQSYLNVTPHQYILSQQLARARTLLAGSTLTIKEIAFECGFENLEVFYRRFHRQSHMPPGEYRRKFLPYHFSKTVDS